MINMQRVTLVKLTDVLAFVLFFLLTCSGIVLHYLLPPRSGRQVDMWGLHRHDWGQLHFWFAVGFFSVLIVHLLLHKHFIVSLIKGGPTQNLSLRFALGVIGLIVMLVLSVIPFLCI